MKRSLFLITVAGAIALVTTQPAMARKAAPGPAGGEAQDPATLTARGTRFGRVLFDGRGRALYAFTRDRRGGPRRGYGARAAPRPGYFAKGGPRARTGLKQALVG